MLLPFQRHLLMLLSVLSFGHCLFDLLPEQSSSHSKALSNHFLERLL